MSYSISMSGHTTDEEGLKLFFEEIVRRSRSEFGLAGAFISSNTFQLRAEDVSDLEPPVSQEGVVEHAVTPSPAEGPSSG